jgi:hypothetical protein
MHNDLPPPKPPPQGVGGREGAPQQGSWGTDADETSFEDSPHKAITPAQNKIDLTPNPVRDKVGPYRANLHPWSLIDGPT